MPATWGFGAAGSEPMTMAGWGYLSSLVGLDIAGNYVLVKMFVDNRQVEIQADNRQVKLNVDDREVEIIN
jgi:hypothetical protein